MVDRCCPQCGKRLVRGERCVFGSKETERAFAKRVYCSYRCCVNAQTRRNMAHYQTCQERLQAAWDEHPDLMEAVIEFRHFKGWFADPREPRWFGDEGDWLGPRFDDALDAIRWLAGVTA